MTSRVGWLGRLLGLACGLCSAPLPLQAHTLSVAHLDIELGAAGEPMRLELDMAVRDLALSLPLDANRDEVVTWGELTAMADPLEAFVASGLNLSTSGGDCRLRPTGLATRRYDDGAYATLQMDATCPSGSAVELRYALLIDRDPQHRALVTVRRGPDATTSIARAGANRIDFAVDDVGSASPFAGFLREGVHHILIGYDHLAFLISLLLPAALIRVRRQWQPTATFRSGFLHVIGIVTAFTLAHSVTLSLAALGWVTPASRWVEAAIAASVLLAALNNLWPLVTRRLWVVGFVFGLIHGFGFAGALGELGLPDGARLLALLGFNLGVELGQLAVVCVLLPLLFAVRGQRWYPNAVMPAASIAIAALAMWWLWQRLAG